MRARSGVVLLCAALCPGAARADALAPGFKSRELRVVIDNLGDYPDHDFYLVAAGYLNPAEGESGPQRHVNPEPDRVTPGYAHRPGYPARFMHCWILVAVDRQRGEPANRWGWEKLAAGTPGVSHSNRVYLSQPPSTMCFNPNDYEVHHFRVALANGELALTPGAIERGSNGFGSWVPALLLAAAVVGFGLWAAHRLTRGRQTTATRD